MEPIVLSWVFPPPPLITRWLLPVAAPGAAATTVAELAALAVVIGPPGPEADQTVTRTAGQAIGGHRVVAIRNDGLAYKVSPPDAEADYVFGLSIGAAILGAPLLIQRTGEVTEGGWSWVAGPVWLGPDGTLTQAVPDAGSVVRIGTAISPTSLFLQPRLIARF